MSRHRLPSVLAIALVILTGCAGDTMTGAAAPSPAVTTPVVTAPAEVSPSEPGTPTPDVTGKPASAELIKTLEGMCVPEGVLDIKRAVLVRHAKVYYVVVADGVDNTDTPVRTSYLYAPFDQQSLDGSGLMKALDDMASQYAPLLEVANDPKAAELASRVRVS